MRVNVGCGRFYAEGWVNLDRVSEGDVRPDGIVSPTRPLAGLSDVDAVYLGHVLEHVEWPKVPAFLRHVREHLAPGGRVCVVGPDVEKALEMFEGHSHDMTWDLLVGMLESDQPQADLGDWPGARHAWNCTEERVIDALTDAGFARVEALPITPEALDGWPVVAYTTWQCAVIGYES